MCLAIPAKVETLDAGNLATVEILGVRRSVAVDLVPQVVVGDYLLVHAGYGIEIIDAQMAQETLDLINEFPEMFASA